MWILFNVVLGMLVVVVLVVKVTFVRDLGDHIIASFFTFIIYLATIAELSRLSRPQDTLKESQMVNGGSRVSPAKN